MIIPHHANVVWLVIIFLCSLLYFRPMRLLITAADDGSSKQNLIVKMVSPSNVHLLSRIAMFIPIMNTVNGKRFAGLNIYGFRSF